MMTPLEKGVFLVAAPSLRDPNFRQTVVLLCEHGEEGALGIVVNRPTAMSLSEALPDVPVLECQQHVVFSGGPVQPTQVLLLYQIPDLPQDTHHVFDGVYLGGDMQVVERALTLANPQGAFRAFVGYSGWAPGQLENEMKTGSWITLPADSSIVFQKEPDNMWRDIVESFGGKYSLYSEMPVDPTLN